MKAHWRKLQGWLAIGLGLYFVVLAFIHAMSREKYFDLLFAVLSFAVAASRLRGPAGLDLNFRRINKD
ncbi:MAG: hypothetical protein H6Q05_4653 [Acidobacteria bacterium]|jgi:hypothetical protein|nr:hypothetical protein [Acidobacteriota bacterium]